MSDVPRAEKETYRYRIDGDNVIIGVSDNWLSFAEKNGGDGRCHPNRVVGMSLLDFVQDMETVHLYEIIIEKVRKTGKPAKFPFRCDSPGTRRFMELVVIPREGGGVELASRAIRTEPRPLVRLLEDDAERSEDFLRVCSMCKKVALSEDRWVEAEEAVTALGLFEKDRMPQLTHGICPACYARAMAELDG